MGDKIFCGSGKEFGQYGQLSLTLDVDTMAKHITNWTDKDGKVHRQVKCKVTRRKEPKPNQTHYVEIDTWKPEHRQEQAASEQLQTMPPTQVPPQDDLPF
jgi:hypothetical protein